MYSVQIIMPSDLNGRTAVSFLLTEKHLDDALTCNGGQFECSFCIISEREIDENTFFFQMVPAYSAKIQGR